MQDDEKQRATTADVQSDKNPNQKQLRLGCTIISLVVYTVHDSGQLTRWYMRLFINWMAVRQLQINRHQFPCCCQTIKSSAFTVQCCPVPRPPPLLQHYHTATLCVTEIWWLFCSVLGRFLVTHAIVVVIWFSVVQRINLFIWNLEAAEYTMDGAKLYHPPPPPCLSIELFSLFPPWLTRVWIDY